MKASKALKKPTAVLNSIIKEEPVTEGRHGFTGGKKPTKEKGKKARPVLDSHRRDKIKRRAKKGVVALR